MNKTETIAAVKEKIGEGKLEDAIDILIKFLDAEKNQNRKFARLALQVKAQFQRAKSDNIKGIIDDDDLRLSYNQVTDRLLNILDGLESNQGESLQEGGFLKKYWPVLLIGLVVLGAGTFFIIKNSIPADQEVAQSSNCPDFDKEALFKVMVLPFKPLDLIVQRTHEAIRERLGTLSDKYKVNISTETSKINYKDKSYPNNGFDAEKLGDSCKAGLIIWGTTEKLQQKVITRTRYKFVDVGDQFSFNMINIKENTEIDTIQTLSSIASEGTITQSLEQSLALLFGIASHRAGENKTAIEVLENAETSDSASALLKGMVLADSYIEEENWEKAKETYDTVLVTHPNYKFALNNRAMINYKDGKYAEAIEDLNAKIEQDPDDVNAFTIRGSAYLQINKLNKAEIDLKTAREKRPDDPYIKKRLETTQDRINEEKSLKEKAQTQLDRNSDDTNALMQFSRASLNLGQVDDAIAKSQELLNKEPRNKTAFATLLEAYLEKGDQEKAEEVIQKAESVGIKKEAIFTESPLKTRISPSRIILREN